MKDEVLTAEMRLKQAYRDLRKRDDPMYELVGEMERSPVWRRTALIVVSLNADPVEYMKAQFVTCEQRFPFVNQLSSTRAVEAYKLTSDKGSMGVRMFNSQEMKVVNLMMRLNISADEIVCDSCIELSPVLRVMLCSDKKFDIVMARWGESARKQLDFDRPLGDYIQDKYNDRAKFFIRQDVATRPAGTPVTFPPVQRSSLSGNRIPAGFRRPCPQSNT